MNRAGVLESPHWHVRAISRRKCFYAHDAVATRLLCLVERRVGPFHQFAPVASVLAIKCRDAGAHRDDLWARLAGRYRHRLDRRAYPFTGGRGMIECLPGERDEELLAPVTVGDVTKATLPDQRLGDGPKDLVAREVTEGVVVALEPVDIDTARPRRCVRSVPPDRSTPLGPRPASFDYRDPSGGRDGSPRSSVALRSFELDPWLARR